MMSPHFFIPSSKHHVPEGREERSSALGILKEFLGRRDSTSIKLKILRNIELGISWKFPRAQWNSELKDAITLLWSFTSEQS